jgi:RNA polymerase sigma-70 factor (ECF subfamily)
VLEGVRKRDPDALGLFFDAAFPYVYGLAFRLSGHSASAEDLTQDVFVSVHRAADRLDPSRHAKPWLTRITYNKFRDHLRRRSSRPERALDPDVFGATPHATETPEEILVGRERQLLLERAIGSLDVKHRPVVVLHTYSGCSHEETSELLGISAAATRKRYSRALAKLRAYILEHQP